MGWDLPDLSLGFDLRILPRARKKHSDFQKTVPLVKSETGLGISQYLCLKKESRLLEL